VFTILDLVQPDNLAEAYQILSDKQNNTILGGCAFLKMGKKRINKGIDLTNLNLSYIQEKDGFIEIGAMTSLRELETHPLVKEYPFGTSSECNLETALLWVLRFILSTVFLI